MTTRTLWTAQHAVRYVRVATPTDDKFSRGVVFLRTGSETYPGAAVLGVEGAWRSGAGLVRYVGAARDLVLQRRPETVTMMVGRAGATVVGSGMTDDDVENLGMSDILDSAWPVVADAGALSSVKDPRAVTVITPHAGEFARLCEKHKLTTTGAPTDDAAALATALAAVVVLKGATTVVAVPRSAEVLLIEAATSWLSTAGTGDVLAGMIGSVIAQNGAQTHAEVAACAATAVYLHSRAGALAAGVDRGQSHPIVALDVAEAIPAAIAELLAGSMS